MDFAATTFAEFWPIYVREHSHPLNRAMHFVGNTGVLACLTAGVITGRARYFLAAPVVGYGCAWVGHFLIEKNRPATFSHPLWSLMADWVMYKKILCGEMAAELERAAT